MASVLPRVSKDGTVHWRVQFRHDGRMMQRTFVNEKGAREFGGLVDRLGASAAMQVLNARTAKLPDVLTLREWTAKYLSPDSGLLTGVEPGTRSGYVQAAERSFLQVLGEYPVDAVQRADVGRWVAWQEKQDSVRGGKVSPKTVRNYHSILSAVMTSAVNEGLRPDNPAYRTRITKGIAHEGVFLSVDEFTTLLHFTPKRHEGLVMFLAGSGCRWGEATAITWGDLNLKANPPTVRITKAWKSGVGGTRVLKQPKSSRARRTISLSQDVVHALGEPGPATQLVFRGPIAGNRVHYSGFMEDNWNPTVEKAMNAELCDKEGVTPLSRRPTPHDLRHTHASWLVASGVPLPYVQVRLGHENISTTVQTYTHLMPDAHSDMAAVITRTLEGVRPLRPLPALEP